MRISTIGAGYVGLVVAACLAKLGNTITLIDVNEARLQMIAAGNLPLHEPGLDEIWAKSPMKLSGDYRKVADAEIIFICVGTPLNKDGAMSLEYVVQASKQIAAVLKIKKEYCVIALKSTVMPGTTENIVIPLLETSGKKAGVDFGVCMDPEFLQEGRAVYHYFNPSRIIIGEYDKESGNKLANLYKDIQAPILRTNLKTAEMIKVASNAFLAARLSLINEIGNICKVLGIDTYEVAQGMGFDERIGNKFLGSGIGFGGSCLPKDLKALVAKSRQIGYEPSILDSVIKLNDEQALRMVELLKRHVSLKRATIGVLGLAFKPGTDDVRESRAIIVVEALLNEGAKVRAYDPIAMDNFRKLFPQIEYSSAADILKCDAILIVTEWAEFSHLDYKGKIVIDGRMVQKAREARIYEGICW
jgi:UDPglucose 6-dehydrogenase